MFAAIAVLAGVMAVAGIFRPLRSVAAEGAAALAMIYAMVLVVATRYFDDVPLWVMLSLALAPAGTAVALIRTCRNRARQCTILAVVVSLVLIAPALIMALIAIHKATAPME